jgi:hypothetical protein
MKRNSWMIQWIGALVAVLGLLYNGVKDYQHGEISFPQIKQKELTKPKYPIQYCLMAYDPNVDKVFYLHENGQWYDYAPQQRRYETATQGSGQAQGKETVGTFYGTQGGSREYYYGQQAQASTHTQRY